MRITKFHGLYWGLVLIILGAGLMAQYYFDFSFPIFRTLAAFAFIYVGLILLIRPRFIHVTGNTVLFSEGNMSFEENQREYNVVFGNAYLDLSNISLASTRSIEVNAVFSGMKVRLGRDVNCVIRSDAAFASYSGPDGNTISFGKNFYQPPWFDPGKPHLRIKANVVFGSLSVLLDQS